MKRRARFDLVYGWTALLLLCVPQSAWACATCFGRSDSDLARGMNWGIFVLLAVVLSVFAAIASFFVFVARRSSRVATSAPTPPFHSTHRS